MGSDQRDLVLVEGYNGFFPAVFSREVALAELRAALVIVRSQDDKSVLTRWVLSPLLFLAGAFAEGAIGVGAEKAIDLVTKLLQ